MARKGAILFQLRVETTYRRPHTRSHVIGSGLFANRVYWLNLFPAAFSETQCHNTAAVSPSEGHTFSLGSFFLLVKKKNVDSLNLSNGVVTTECCAANTIMYQQMTLPDSCNCFITMLGISTEFRLTRVIRLLGSLLVECLLSMTKTPNLSLVSKRQRLLRSRKLKKQHSALRSTASSQQKEKDRIWKRCQSTQGVPKLGHLSLNFPLLVPRPEWPWSCIGAHFTYGMHMSSLSQSVIIFLLHLFPFPVIWALELEESGAGPSTVTKKIKILFS